MAESSSEARSRLVVTIVTPVYNEEENLPRYERAMLETVFSIPKYEFKVLFIDDGSADRSWEIIKEISKKDPRFSGIRLSRNYGSQIALAAGIERAEGDALIALSCDLQDPPELIPEFLAKWKAGAGIVWGGRDLSAEKGLRGVAGRLYHSAMRRFALPEETKFTTGSYFLIDGSVAECFRGFPERNRVTFALLASAGFEQDTVRYRRAPRIAGKSGWTAGRQFKALLDSFFGYSLIPVRLIYSFGALLIAMFLAAGIFSAYRFVTTGAPDSLSIILAVFFLLFGIQCFLMGLLGEYLFRIYSESVRRPLYFISDRTGDARGRNE